MSLNFSAEQYQDSYLPKRLSQWEIPKKFSQTPRSREGYTFSVCDKSGRYLPNVEKPVFKEWSSFVGTWGKDFSKPGAVKGVEVKPGMWICK
ncbi:hypothetical protein X975_18827, partial [Stegodyphus mimosarum]